MTKKILLLHGNRQTGQVLLGRLDRFRRKLLEELEIEFKAPDAPFEVPGDGEAVQFTWWELHENTYSGLEEALKLFDSPTWNDDDIIGIMGFSQGARLLHLLLLMRNSPTSTLLPGLKFAILASGYDAPLPDNLCISATERIELPSLHIFGENDTLILPEQSKALMEKYWNPIEHSHPGRHFIPAKKSDVEIYIEFIRSTLIPSRQHNEGSKTEVVVDDENAIMQSDEVQVLLAMFPDDIMVKSEFQLDGDGEFRFQYPIRYHVNMRATDPDERSSWPIHPLTIQVTYPMAYPSQAIPEYRLIHQNTNFEFPSGRADMVLRILHDTSQLELGMPSVLSGIYGVKAYLDETPNDNVEGSREEPQQWKKKDMHHFPSLLSTPEKLHNNDNGREHEPPEIGGFIAPSIPELVSSRNREGLEIAERILKESEQKNTYSVTSRSNKSDGGSWNYVIGLIGKPSAGKSTFFNAATAFARGDGACMAAHPFTTIDPNTGYCFVPAPYMSCPEDNTPNPSDYASTHGRSPDGRRFLPIFLKDVAGLVPGAYQGKGKGNQFLNDLTDATVLIHVLDASGTSDPSGNKVAVDSTLEDLSNPLDDIAWIRDELVEWIYSNLCAKWEGVQRRGRSRLVKMFSGYGQREADTHAILTELEGYLEKTYQKENAFGDLPTWDEADIHLLVSTFLGVRFPMTLALNKYDLPSSHAYVENIQKSLPIHGAYHGTPMAAEQEMMFVRNAIATSRVSAGKEIDTVYPPPRNVWACLTSAVSLKEPVLVFPVVDMVSYGPLPGLNRSAAEDASLPSDGMICCIERSGGSLPSCFDISTGNYSVPKKEKSSQQKLRDVLIMKPGTTVEEVFLCLKRLGALSGEFVRAEAACNIGDKPRPIPKLDTITRNSRIIKIMSNRRTAWQS